MTPARRADLLLGFVAPRVVTDLARSAVPLPSAQDFRARVAAGLLAAWLLSQLPEVRDYLQSNGPRGCSCRG